MFGLKQLIVDATRITANSSSTIDHVISNSKEKVSDSGVLNHSFSDHLPVFCTRKLNRSSIFQPVIKRVRSLKHYSQEILLQSLQNVNWNDVYSAINVDVALDSFIRIFHGILDNIAPYKEMRIKSKTEPWMNANILAGIRCRNELFGKFKKNRDRADIYKQYCTVQ